MSKREIKPCDCGQKAQFAIHNLGDLVAGSPFNEWPPVFCCSNCLAQKLLDINNNRGYYESVLVLLVEVLVLEQR